MSIDISFWTFDRGAAGKAPSRGHSTWSGGDAALSCLAVNDSRAERTLIGMRRSAIAPRRRSTWTCGKSAASPCAPGGVHPTVRRHPQKAAELAAAHGSAIRPGAETAGPRSTIAATRVQTGAEAAEPASVTRPSTSASSKSASIKSASIKSASIKSAAMHSAPPAEAAAVKAASPSSMESAEAATSTMKSAKSSSATTVKSAEPSSAMKTAPATVEASAATMEPSKAAAPDVTRHGHNGQN